MPITDQMDAMQESPSPAFTLFNGAFKAKRLDVQRISLPFDTSEERLPDPSISGSMS